MNKCKYYSMELKNDGEFGVMFKYVITDPFKGWGRGAEFCPGCAQTLQLKEVTEKVKIPASINK